MATEMGNLYFACLNVSYTICHYLLVKYKSLIQNSEMQEAMQDKCSFHRVHLHSRAFI